MDLDREGRSTGTREPGGRPPPAAWDCQGRNGAARAHSALGKDLTLRVAGEEVGLTLTPPPRYRSLLVPVDGGPFGEHALPVALGIARRAGAEVRVVHVYRPLETVDLAYPPYYDVRLDAFLRRRQQTYLDDLLRRVRRVTSVPVAPVFLEGGDVADSLRAASVGADLVVMATHGRGSMGRLWFGSVADVLSRRLSVPLLLVRGYGAPADLTGDPLVRHVLIPLDGSALAEQVLEPAVALGTLTGAEHTLLRIIRPGVEDSVGHGHATPRPPGEGRQAEAWNYLRRVAWRLGGRTLRVHPRIVLDEQPTARAILHYAQTHDADLIALATRGHRGLTRLFRGGVADRVVRGASVPVLVYRAEADEGRATP